MDGFEDLAGAPEPDASWDLASAVSTALGEEPGRVEMQADGDRAWLVRDGLRVSSIDPAAVDRTDAERRERFARALADLVRRVDELRPTVEALEPGRVYRVDYKHERLRRMFRVKATLIEVSAFRPASGVSGGGWTLRFETHPRFGTSTGFEVDTAVLSRIVPD
jgi:hypothetical protein